MGRRNPFVILSRLRSIDEKLQRAELAAARNAHEEARMRLDEYKAKHRESIPVEELIAPVELQSLRLRGVVTHEALQRAAAEFDRSRKNLEVRADGWRRAAADLEAAEELEARKRDESARQARIASERTLDDLMGMLHARPQATGE